MVRFREIELGSGSGPGLALRIGFGIGLGCCVDAGTWAEDLIHREELLEMRCVDTDQFAKPHAKPKPKPKPKPTLPNPTLNQNQKLPELVEVLDAVVGKAAQRGLHGALRGGVAVVCAFA